MCEVRLYYPLLCSKEENTVGGARIYRKMVLMALVLCDVVVELACRRVALATYELQIPVAS